MVKTKLLMTYQEKIRNLESKVSKHEEHLIDNTNDDDQSTNFLDKTIVNPSMAYKCKNCDFDTENESDLDQHMKIHEETEKQLNCQLYAVVQRDCQAMGV